MSLGMPVEILKVFAAAVLSINDDGDELANTNPERPAMVAAIVEDRDVHEAMGLLGPTLKLDTDEFTINEAKAQALMDAFFPKMADAQE
ncbi:hypothetical protein N7485_007474 [Penicillium canescens]|nr:hypothetical protein N7485_007474 [Penicillium canescens]